MENGQKQTFEEFVISEVVSARGGIAWKDTLNRYLTLSMKSNNMTLCEWDQHDLEAAEKNIREMYEMRV